MSERSAARLRRLAAGVPFPDNPSGRSAQFRDHCLGSSRSAIPLLSAMAPAPVGASAAATQPVGLPSGPHHTWVIVRPLTSPDPARYSPGWSAPLSEPLVPE